MWNICWSQCQLKCSALQWNDTDNLKSWHAASLLEYFTYQQWCYNWCLLSANTVLIGSVRLDQINIIIDFGALSYVQHFFNLFYLSFHLSYNSYQKNSMDNYFDHKQDCPHNLNHNHSFLRQRCISRGYCNTQIVQYNAMYLESGYELILGRAKSIT